MPHGARGEVGDTTGLALGLVAAGMVLLDLAAQVWQDGQRWKSKRDAGGDGSLDPARWQEVKGWGGMRLGGGLTQACCYCKYGVAGDKYFHPGQYGCIYTACTAGPGRLLWGPIAMLQRLGASIPGAVLSLFVPLPLSNRAADHDRVAIISGLATAAIATAAIATDGAHDTGEVVDPTLAAAVCLAMLAVRLVLHGAVIQRLKSASGTRTDVVGPGMGHA